MAAVHDHGPLPALRPHVLLIVLVVICRQFGFWQDPLGQDEFLGDGPGSEQSAHTREVGVALPDLAGQLVGQVIELPGYLLAERGEKLSGSPIAAYCLGSHRAQCRRAITPYRFMLMPRSRPARGRCSRR